MISNTLLPGVALPNVLSTAHVRVTLFFALVLAAVGVNQPLFFIIGSLICALYVIIENWPLNLTKKHLYYFLMVSLFFIPAFLNFYHGRMSPLFYFFSTISVFLAAYSITKNSDSDKALSFAFRFVFLCMLLLITWALYKYWGKFRPLHRTICTEWSTNFVTFAVIIIQIGLSLSTYVANGKLPIISPLLTAAVAFFGGGRGSLLAAGIIIVLTSLFNFILSGRKQRLIVAIFFVGVILVIGIYGKELWHFLWLHTMVSQGWPDASRIEMCNQYFDSLSPWEMLVGNNYDGTIISSTYNNNPHNAFIRAHSFFGLPVALSALFSPFVVFFFKRDLMTKLIFFCFTSILIIRAITDAMLFPSLFDFFYFLCFFMCKDRRATLPYKQRKITQTI